MRKENQNSMGHLPALYQECLKNIPVYWVWWFTSVFPDIRRRWQVNQEIEVSLNYIERPYLKEKNTSTY
jgi:hypothetical protein